MNNNELYHYGVKGMRWGHRKARGHAGPGKYATKKRQLAGDKRDLDTLNKGGHLSVGLTKKRQAKFDARDKNAIEKRIDDASNDKGVNVKYLKRKLKNNINKGKMFINQMTNNDIAISQMNNWAMQEATRQSINASLMGASLSMSGGTNPFMFGMM